MIKTIREVAQDMVDQDSRMTMAPVWIYGAMSTKFPKVFFTDKAAEEYCVDNHLDERDVTVASAHDCPEMLLVMGQMILQAGLEETGQAKNAYVTAVAAAVAAKGGAS